MTEIIFYVDDMMVPATIGGRRAYWSHLFCDPPDTEALVKFGEQIGLRRSWIQHPFRYKVHFDITNKKREDAIKAGAIPVTTREAGMIWRKQHERENHEKNAQMAG